METLAELTSRHARSGLLMWIGIRPKRLVDVLSLPSVNLTRSGVEGDHYQSGGKRSVTLIQIEHLQAIGSFLQRDQVRPEELRRNLMIGGINLLGLRDRQFSIGSAVLEGTGICAPCSRMEKQFGLGGYTAVRGHGGITARILEPGEIAIGDEVMPL